MNFKNSSLEKAQITNHQKKYCLPVFLKVVKMTDIFTANGSLRFNAKNAKKYNICLAQDYLMMGVEIGQDQLIQMNWKKAEQFSVGDFLLCFDDFYKNKQKPVLLIKMLAIVVDAKRDVNKILFSDISVQSHHNYLVTELGLLVHNFEVLQAVAPALGGYVSIAFGSGLGPICTGFGPIGGILGLGVGTVIAYQLYQKNKQSRQPKQTPIQHPTPAGGSPPPKKPDELDWEKWLFRGAAATSFLDNGSNIIQKLSNFMSKKDND